MAQKNRPRPSHAAPQRAADTTPAPEHGSSTVHETVAAHDDGETLSLDPGDPARQHTAEHGALLSDLSSASMAAYRKLVYETEGFVDYYRAATPIAEIADLKIGSRPSSRTASTRIEDLRAIPWVFSWSQSRVMLPGWFGFGSAVQVLEPQPLAERVRRAAVAAFAG